MDSDVADDDCGGARVPMVVGVSDHVGEHGAGALGS